MHHQYEITEKSGILGKYMTFFDFIIYAIFTNILKTLIFGSNIKHMIFIDMVDYIGTIFSHSDVIPKTIKHHHYAHHKYKKCNYGMTPFSDWIFGTLKN